MGRINFSKLLAEQENLYKGSAMLMMDSKGSLKDNARNIAEQKRDILYVLSDLDASTVYALNESLGTALEGFMAFTESMDDLRESADELQDSDSANMPPIGEVLEKLRENAADQGLILKSLYEVTQTFIEHDTTDQ